MYTTIIFDFFDVIRNDPLKHWLKEHEYAPDAAFREINKKLDLGHLNVEEFFVELNKQSGHPIETMQKIYEGTTEMSEELPGFIAELSQKYRIGLLSNAPAKYLRDLLKKHEYDDLFHTVVISSEVGIVKPSEEAFKHILVELQALPQESIFVDDKPTNVQAAKKLGITGLVFKDFPRLKSDLANLGVKVDPTDRGRRTSRRVGR